MWRYFANEYLQCITLLNLPLEPEEGQVSLKEASQDLFATNARAEQLITRLGVKLSNYEARTILGRRVEANDLA